MLYFTGGLILIMKKVLCSELAGASYRNNRLYFSASTIRKNFYAALAEVYYGISRLHFTSSLIKKILCVILLLMSSFIGVSYADNGLNVTA